MIRASATSRATASRSRFSQQGRTGWKEASTNIQLKGISSALFRSLQLGVLIGRDQISLWCSLWHHNINAGHADPATSVTSTRRTRRRRSLSNCCVISLGQLNGLQAVTLMNRCRSAGKLLFTVSCALPPHTNRMESNPVASNIRHMAPTTSQPFIPRRR